MKEITLQLTDECNLACSYCFSGQKNSLSISDNDFAYFVEFCNNNDIESIHITGGEPMMYSHFIDCISILSRIAYIVVYSNFTIPNVIQNLDTHDRDIIFLVNINHQEEYTAEQWKNLWDNVETAKNKGIRMAFGHTFHRESITNDFKYMVSLNYNYSIKLLRMSYAIMSRPPYSSLSHIERVRELYSLVASKYDELLTSGVKCYFDCPIPACWLDKNTYATLREKLVIPTHCQPKVFTMWDLSLHHCYIEPRIPSTKTLRDFTSWNDAREYIEQNLRKVKRTRGSRCIQCSNGEYLMGCGCPITNSYTFISN